tara:strand:- start:4427 stop:5281 length:855 start_codon:yes stop_codon:yes gene_type:complete
MQDKTRVNKFLKKVFHKYRFVIMTDDSFEERFSLKLSKLNLFSFLGVFVFLCFFAMFFLVSYTSLSEYLPGKAKSEVHSELVLLTLKADSLIKALELQKNHLDNINNIIRGKELISPENNVNTTGFDPNLSFEKSINDSLLRIAVESEERGSLSIDKKEKNDVIMFFTPIKGLITDAFSFTEKHFGVDLVAKEKTRVCSVLEGTVVFSNWTSETGYVIGIQHKNGYFSLYKHNSTILKSVGDFVKTGEHIAIIGNSGEFSSGTHLHFELWRKGVPVNPENYILF